MQSMVQYSLRRVMDLARLSLPVYCLHSTQTGLELSLLGQVFDEHGSSDMDYLNIFVWNHVIATATTASGVTMEYNNYDGANEFGVSLVDSDTEYTQD